MESWRRMNLNNIIFLFIFFGILSFGITKAQECKGKVSIHTNNDSSLIFINNEFIGNGNISKEVDNGKYLIKVSESSENWNAKSFIDTIQIINCEEKKIDYNFYGSVYLQTNPADAYVFNDDKLIGHTPLKLKAENQNLLLKKNGFKDKYITINQIEENKTISLEQLFNGKEISESFFVTTEFKILLGSLVALGGATAYYKLKADKKFDEYQFTGSGELLDQTRKYDLISGITFGLVQINFGILVYYFLFDK